MSAPGDEAAAIAARAQVFRSGHADGGTIMWRCWVGPPGGDAGRPSGGGLGDTLLLLHGSFGSWTHWLRNIETWSAAVRVVAVDMPGFGESDAQPGDRSPGALAAMLADGWAQFCAAQGPSGGAGSGRVFVGGFSLGAVYAGWLARALMADHAAGPRVAGLLLLSPGGLGARPAQRPWMRRTDDRDGSGAREARLAVHRHNLALVMFGDPGRIDETAVRLQAANVENARFRRPPGQAQDLLLALLPKMALPVLGVWGGRDAFDADVGVRVAALRAAVPAAETVVIAGAGHWVGYEAAAEVNPVVLRWLSSIST